MSNWTAYEIALLRQLHGKESARKIGERIGRTKRSVAIKSSQLGLRMNKSTQVELMRDSYRERMAAQ